MIRVGIISDNAVLARTLADLLSEDGRFQATSVSPFAFTGGEHEFTFIDVIIVTSRSLVRSIPAGGPPVLVVSREGNLELEFRPPVRGWIASNPTASELSAAVAAIAENLVILTDEQAKRFMASARQMQDGDSVLEPLTGRERQVLRMLADGLGNKEIAKQLGISEHTAKFHVAQILAKLGASSRAEAVAIGMRRGLVPV